MKDYCGVCGCGVFFVIVVFVFFVSVVTDVIICSWISLLLLET